jgi:hypothetical protein
MSKKNIISKEKVRDKVHVTFDAHDGVRVYEYRGAAARAINKGRDPGGMAGKLISHKK